jgi:hypothetical protein
MLLRWYCTLHTGLSYGRVEHSKKKKKKKKKANWAKEKKKQREGPFGCKKMGNRNMQ